MNLDHTPMRAKALRGAEIGLVGAMEVLANSWQQSVTTSSFIPFEPTKKAYKKCIAQTDVPIVVPV